MYTHAHTRIEFRRSYNLWSRISGEVLRLFSAGRGIGSFGLRRSFLVMMGFTSNMSAEKSKTIT